ncbi:hypothetical protein FRC20_007476 [Serendipita sp. 405]|nr:hypothetical protein FRC16_008994 [Serendipita sp. 398]KAG8866817.1 hypothetical protein FRC20_007476 [Serendipita sp. 405]
MVLQRVLTIYTQGEQSVGKSYSLNHFADTSFAGSAMRCTQGVWLSVTPCKDELLVTMDFEGGHSGIPALKITDSQHKAFIRLRGHSR